MTGHIQPSRTRRVLVYILVVTLAFALSAGAGALAALALRGELGFTEREKPRPSEVQGIHQQSEKQGTPQQSEKQGTPQQSEKQGTPQRSEADYVSKVGKLQSESVKAFLDSHYKLLHYDALSADDVEELQANQAAVQGFANQTGALKPPQKFRTQKEVLLSAINELNEAAQLAYALAADPTSATQSGFEEYDSHVDKAAALLQRSNEILDRDYKTIEGVQGVGSS